MADDSEVAESWEDLIKDEPKNEPKDESDKPSKSKKKTKSKDGSRSKTVNNSDNELNDRFNNLYLSDSIQSKTTKPGTNSYSSILNKNLPAGSIKILNRTAATPASGSSAYNSTNSAIIIDGLSTNSSKNLQITFEDNTPTQFIAQVQNTKVKILQRPKADSKNDSNDPNGLIKNGFFNAKTIQEREVEYARARERIFANDRACNLGTDQENDPAESPTNSQLPSANSRPPNNQQTNRRNDLVRTPAGPSGQAGFVQRR